MDRSIKVNVYDNSLREWSVPLDGTINVGKNSAIIRMRVDLNGNEGMDAYFVENETEWVTVERRFGGEVWLYVDSNHVNEERVDNVTFMHRADIGLEVRYMIRQEADDYEIKVKFDDNGDKEKSLVAYKYGDETYDLIDQEVKMALNIKGGRKKFILYVQKERRVEYTEGENRVQNWVPCRNDGSVEITRQEYKEPKDDYDVYDITLTCHGTTEKTDGYRYGIVAEHCDDPYDIRDTVYIDYNGDEDVPSGNIIRLTDLQSVRDHTVVENINFNEIAYNAAASEQTQQDRPMHAPQANGGEEYYLEFVGLCQNNNGGGADNNEEGAGNNGGTDNDGETGNNGGTEIQCSYGTGSVLCFKISENANLLCYQSSDFIIFADKECSTLTVGEGESGKYKIVCKEIKIDMTKTSYTKRCCKLRFSLSTYPTLYEELYVCMEKDATNDGKYNVIVHPTSGGKIDVALDDNTRLTSMESGEGARDVKGRAEDGDEISITLHEDEEDNQEGNDQQG